jgi:hypothetical protein
MTLNPDLAGAVRKAHPRQGHELLQTVHDFLGRFVSYPCEHSQIAHTLWILHTHLMDRWESTPRLAFLSAEPQSGKTRALEISEMLVPTPVATVNVSPAYLFRKVGSEKNRPTILYDEIDTVFGPKAKDNEEIRALLNAGHRRGAVTGRCVVRGKTVETEEIPAYAAVAMAGLGWLPDTILSRSVIIRMRRRKTGEQVEPYRRRLHAEEGEQIRTLIADWAAKFPTEVNWPELPPEIQDRDADIWEALIAVAEAAGGPWPLRARETAIALVTAAKQIEPTLGIRLVSDLKAIFGEAEQMSTAAILTALHGIEEAPWADLKGKPLDSRRLAKLLREYDVKSKDIRTASSTLKGYVRADLVDVWSRYLPSDYPDVAPISATVADSPSENASKINGVADVALVAHLGGNGGEPASDQPSIKPPDDLLSTPDFLLRHNDQAPALGPPGDSLEDFR